MKSYYSYFIIMVIIILIFSFACSAPNSGSKGGGGGGGSSNNSASTSEETIDGLVQDFDFNDNDNLEVNGAEVTEGINDNAYSFDIPEILS